MTFLGDWKVLSPEQRLERIEPYRVAGDSASEIAARFSNCTRNSVIGALTRAHRQLGGRDPNIRVRPSAQHGNKGQPKVNGIIARAEKRGVTTVRAIQHRAVQRAELQHANNTPFREGRLPDEDDAGVDVTALVGIMDLNASTCRWPHGDPHDPTFGFCGKPPLEGKPYCGEHDRRAHARTGATE